MPKFLLPYHFASKVKDMRLQSFIHQLDQQYQRIRAVESTLMHDSATRSRKLKLVATRALGHSMRETESLNGLLHLSERITSASSSATGITNLAQCYYEHFIKPFFNIRNPNSEFKIHLTFPCTASMRDKCLSSMKAGTLNKLGAQFLVKPKQFIWRVNLTPTRQQNEMIIDAL